MATRMPGPAVTALAVMGLARQAAAAAGGLRAFGAHDGTPEPRVAWLGESPASRRLSISPTCRDTAPELATNGLDFTCVLYNQFEGTRINFCGYFDNDTFVAYYDDTDFSAFEMCCACGGGEPTGYEGLILRPQRPDPEQGLTDTFLVNSIRGPTLRLQEPFPVQDFPGTSLLISDSSGRIYPPTILLKGDQHVFDLSSVRALNITYDRGALAYIQSLTVTAREGSSFTWQLYHRRSLVEPWSFVTAGVAWVDFFGIRTGVNQTTRYLAINITGAVDHNPLSSGWGLLNDLSIIELPTKT